VFKLVFIGLLGLFIFDHAQALVIDGVDYPMSMHVLDVDKGDSIYINCGDKHLLIDAGEANMGGRVVSALRNLGVTHLDEVIVTHYHSDHFGGMAQVFQAFPVGKVILPNNPSVRPAAFPIPTGIPTELGGADHNLGQLHLKKLTPDQPIIGGHNPNDESQIWKATFGSKSFLLMGDAEIAERDALLTQFSGGDLQADVLKVPHHGDGRVTDDGLLNAVQPSYAVISTTNAFMNAYNNLTQITAAFNAYRPTTFMINNVKQTYADGNIIYATDGANISVRSRRNSQQIHNHGEHHTIPLYDPISGRRAGGSNDNGWYKGLDNKNYLVKFTGHNLSNQEMANRAANELIAIKLYRQMDINVPDARLIQDINGKIGIAVEERQIQDVNFYDEMWNLTGLQEGFAVDCFLGNWDVIGSHLGQNLCRDLLSSTNQAIRIDAGGSLLYRAQGAPKGTRGSLLAIFTDYSHIDDDNGFHNDVKEFETFLNPSHNITAQSFKKITFQQLKYGLNKIRQLSEAQIRDIANTYGMVMANNLKDTIINKLISRKNYIHTHHKEIIRSVSQAKVRLGEPAFARPHRRTRSQTPNHSQNSSPPVSPIPKRSPSAPAWSMPSATFDKLEELLEVHRAYSGQIHHYTPEKSEVQCLLDQYGWESYEGVAFRCYKHSKEGRFKIYRLYNPNDKLGNHLLTINEHEVELLVAQGWILEDSIGYVAINHNMKRIYNPGTGEHFYTESDEEVENALAAGWTPDGTVW
jgi:beta-lactamase superfamily II metal-dependent hydrolase